MNTILEVENIDVFRAGIQILWDVSLNVKKGEIVSIIGSNGAGKTTILRTISGLHKVKKGKIKFMNVDITNLEPHKRVEMGLGHVPEGRQLFPKLTVLENLKCSAYTRRAKETFLDTLEMIYNLFPILKERKNQLAGTLSGGEQQMLAIARALILRPLLLMLDEPSSGLAPKIVIEIAKLIKNLRNEGYTILLVEQNSRIALKLSDRAYVLENGRIVKEGEGLKLLEDPDVKKAYLGL